MRGLDGRKITVISAKDAASEAMLRASPATMYDLQPLQQQLLNVGAVLHSVAGMLEGFETQINDLTARVSGLEAASGITAPSAEPPELSAIVVAQK